jgi:AAA domain
MNDPYPYVDSAVGGVNKRNNVIRLDEYAPNGHVDCFTTYLRFPESFRAHVEHNAQQEGSQSVKGYRGVAKADFVPLDYDDEHDQNRALEDVRRSLRMWEAKYDLPMDAVRIFFSGNKGFHLEIPEELCGGIRASKDIARNLKTLAAQLREDAQSLDADIYDTVRLWRTPNTRHGKTRLYKVPISTEELFTLTLEEIRELAKQPRPDFSQTEADEYGPVPALVDLWRAIEDGAVDTVGHHEPLKVAEVLNGIPQGERDTKLFRTAAKMRGADVPYAFARKLILEAASNCDPPFPEADAIRKVDSAYKNYEPNPEFAVKKDSSVYRDEVAEERNLPFKTARQVAEETPAKVEWIGPPWFAKGCITEIDGKIKAGGKTTWVSHAAGRIAEGKPFMGQPTTKSKVVFLTEQPPASFRKVLERANLEDQEDVVVLHWYDTAGFEWPEVAQAAIAHAFTIGAGLLIVDTLGQFAGIKGDGENNAGAAQEAMKPLQEAAAKGLAVGFTRHERKGGGEVGEAGRGSSAFGGAVDIILSIRRAEGNTRPTVRVIESLSRFDETPDKLVIELTEDGYRSLGDASAFAEKEAMSAIVDLLPTKEENAMPTADILDRLKDQDIKRTVANEALVKLTSSGTIEKFGQGKRGNPYRYYKPVVDEKLSSETPGGSETKLSGHPPVSTNTPDAPQSFLSSGTSTYTRKKEKTLLVNEDVGVDL